MRTKVTLVLLLLNVALLAVIIYARREWQADQESARFSKRVLGNEAIGMNSLEITSEGKTQRIRLERPSDNAPWELKDPINWPANDFAVRRIIHELEFLEAETSFAVEGLAANGQSLADYGLKPSKLTLTFTRPAAVPGAPALTTRLEIGDTTKVGNRLYVLSPDGKKVHVVGRSLAESLVVGMEELRTDTLFTIPVFEVRSLGMQNAAPAPRVRLRRDGSQWAFEAPIVTRSNKAPTEVVISGLNRLRAVDFLTAAQVAESGLDKPVMRVTVEGNSRRETLLVGRVYPVKITPKKDDSKKDPAPATSYYARMEDRTQVFVTTIPDSLFETLRRAQETLREPRILDFDPGLVTTVSLGAPGQRDPLVLRRNDTTGWQIVPALGGPALAADTTLITHLLQRLALLTVASPVPGESGYLRDAPSDAEIENFGFNLPQREITLTLAPVAAATGGLAAPRRLTLQIGASSLQGGTLQARVLGQSFIYAVAADTLNSLPVAPLFYRDRTVRTLPEGARITGIKLMANAAPEQPLVNLSLAEGQTWDDALTSETEVRRTALKTVLANLTTLRAKQFVTDAFTTTTIVDGQPTPWKYALEATLALGGAADTQQKSVTTLQIAERSGGGAQLAGSAEFGVVFSVEQTLLDALWLLTYGARDPGPPAAPVVPAVPTAPAVLATPEAPVVPAVSAATELPALPSPVTVVPVAAP